MIAADQEQSFPTPVPRRSFGRNVSWAAVGGVAYAAGNWIQLAALAKIVSPADVGLFAFALALSAPIMILAGLQLRTVQVTDASGAYAFGDYLALRMLTVTLGVAAVLGVALVGGYDRIEVLAITAIAVAKAVDNISDLFYGAFQRAEELDRSAKGLILNAAVSTILTIVVVLLTEQVLWACMAVASGSAVVLVAYVLPAARARFAGEVADPLLAAGMRPRWSARRLAPLTRIAAPLGVAGLLMSLNANLPRYVVERSLGRSELGIFATMASVVVIAALVMAPLAQAALPRVSTAYARGDRRAFVRTLVLLVAFAVATGLVAIALVLVGGDTVVGIVFTDAYTGQGNLLAWLTVAAAISLVIFVLDVGLSAAQRFQVQLSANLLSAVATLGASLLLVPPYGMEGAAWAICISLAVQAASKAISLTRATAAIGAIAPAMPTRPLVPALAVQAPTAAVASLAASPRLTRTLGGRTHQSRERRGVPDLPLGALPAGVPAPATPSPTRVERRPRIATTETANVLIAAVLCLVVLLLLLMSSDQLAHWFVVPVYLCGVLIGRDAVRWFFSGCDLLDPVGLLGVLGLHFFFLVPLLHVSTGLYMRYIIPPDDWRVWLGKMAWINLAGIGGYQLGRSLLGSPRGRERPVATIWRADPHRLTALIVAFMALSAVLQTYVYFRFGGIGGYIQAFSSVFSTNAFEGLGLIYMFSETLPILAVFLYAFWSHRTGRGTSWMTIGAVLLAFFVVKILFGGLRGSRSNVVWPAFWSLGLIHLWVRPIGRRAILTGAALLVFFMYGYAYYKNYGTDALRAARGQVYDENRDRSLEQIIIGDLGRSDVQAFLLYRLSPESEGDYQLALGRTYVGASSLIIPRRIWPGRPEGKSKEGTEALYGTSGFGGSNFRSTYAYGLAGETMLNFGPWAIPVAYLLFGVAVGVVQRWRARIPPDDAQTLLVPLVVSLCVFVLVWDSDVIFYYAVTSGVVPVLVVWLSGDRVRSSVVARAFGSTTPMIPRPASSGFAIQERTSAT